MTDEERNTFFKTHIEKLKKEDQEKAKVKLSAISFGNSFEAAGFSQRKVKENGIFTTPNLWALEKVNFKEFGEIDL